MGGNYGKNVFNQLMEVMAKLDTMEQENNQNRRKIKSLTDEVTSLQ